MSREPLYEVAGVRAGYGQGDVLFGVDLRVGTRETVAVLGPNGAGKSTLLRVMAGGLEPRTGHLRFQGLEVTDAPPAELARCGLYLVPEGRAVFPSLTVRENLRMATGRPERQWGSALEEALEVFPRLGERLDQQAGTMSGGEQQMLALARAWIAKPLLLLLDEPSLGLAPIVVEEVFAAVERFKASGMAVVLVEQYVHRALAVADSVVLLEKGRVTHRGPPDGLAADELADRYLGMSA